MWNKGTTFKSQSRDKTEFSIGSNIRNSHYRARAADSFFAGFAFFNFQEKFKVFHGLSEESSFLSLICHFLNYQEKNFVSPPSKELLKKSP